MTQLILFNIFNGLIVGAFYALMALGLSLILNLSGVINFAHGGFLAIGGYIAFSLSPYIGFWGALIGLIFLNPLFGFAVGAAAWAVSGALRDVGIDDGFMKELGETLKPGTAALCVLIRQMTKDKVLEEIKQYGGTLIKTNLCHENETKLREALASAQKAAGSPVT